MNPVTRNSVVAGTVVALAVGVVTLITAPAVVVTKWVPKQGRIYPRIIQPRNMSDSDYGKMMEAKGKPVPK